MASSCLAAKPTLTTASSFQLPGKRVPGVITDEPLLYPECSKSSSNADLDELERLVEKQHAQVGYFVN